MAGYSQTFFDLPTGPADSFLGLPIRRVDGVDLAATRTAFESAVTHTRATRGPSLLLMELERLSDHTNADDQALYRAADELKSGKNRDPLEAIRQALRESQMGDSALAQLETSLIAEVAAAVVEARGEAVPQTAGASSRTAAAGFRKTTMRIERRAQAAWTSPRDIGARPRAAPCPSLRGAVPNIHRRRPRRPAPSGSIEDARARR